MNISNLLKFLYAKERHIILSCFWDAGWQMTMHDGDGINIILIVGYDLDVLAQAFLRKYLEMFPDSKERLEMLEGEG